ncbi:MAG TPA: mechanosensitive ion channel domain-containing protein [Burkholderiales bacterium]|nr:mechanosensitive ion channel domain-containing protein [Burkholderiales bacterium]
MKENQIGRLLADLWSDLREPTILWQAGALALCLLVAWWFSRLLQWRASEDSGRALKHGAAAFRRVVFPLLSMLLLVAARTVLRNWHTVNLLTVAIALFGAMAGIRFAVYLLRLAFSHAAWLGAFERSIATLVWAVLALHLTGLLPEIVTWLSDVDLNVGKHSFSLWTLLNAVFWMAMTLLLALWAGAALEEWLMRAEGLHSSLRVVFARLARAGLLIAAVMVVLPLMGVDLTVLSVFGGALGVGLGLGLQKIASNYFSGFLILLDRSIRLGDMITVDGQYGEVTRITTRYTVVRSLTGVEAILPNDTLVTTTVLNHSFSDKRVRLTVRLQVAYRTDIPKVLELLAKIARGTVRVLKEPAPLAQVTNLADSGVDIELGFWIDDPEQGTQNVRSEVSVQILAAFKAQGIEIPFPQREVRLLGGQGHEV